MDELNRFATNKRINSFLLGLATILYAAYYLVKFSGDYVTAEDASISYASFILVAVYAFCGYAWIKTTQRVFSPFFVLLASCFAFNAGQVFLHLVGVEINNWFDVYDATGDVVLLKTLCFQTLCVLSLTWGAILAVAPMVKLRREEYKYSLSISSRTSDWIDKLFIIVAFMVVYEYVQMLISRGSFAYSDGEERAGGLFYIVKYSFVILLYYQLYRHNDDKWLKISLATGAFVALAIFVCGARYSVMPILLGMLFVFFTIKRTKLNLTFKQKVVLVVVVLLFLSLMRGWTILRNYPLSEISWEKVKAAYSTGLVNSFYDTLAETGKSINTITHTISTVDAGNATDDRTIFHALLLGVVPEKVTNVLNIKPEISSLSAWITKIIGVRNGQGYSIFAEAYFNYRNFGFLFMLVFGFIFVKLENQTIKLFHSDISSETMLACAILYLISYACFLSRADFKLMSSYIRFVLYVCVVIVIKRRGVLFVKKKDKYNSSL